MDISESKVSTGGAALSEQTSNTLAPQRNWKKAAKGTHPRSYLSKEDKMPIGGHRGITDLNQCFCIDKTKDNPGEINVHYTEGKMMSKEIIPNTRSITSDGFNGCIMTLFTCKTTFGEHLAGKRYASHVANGSRAIYNFIYNKKEYSFNQGFRVLDFLAKEGIITDVQYARPFYKNRDDESSKKYKKATAKAAKHNLGETRVKASARIQLDNDGNANQMKYTLYGARVDMTKEDLNVSGKINLVNYNNDGKGLRSELRGESSKSIRKGLASKDTMTILNMCDMSADRYFMISKEYREMHLDILLNNVNKVNGLLIDGVTPSNMLSKIYITKYADDSSPNKEELGNVWKWENWITPIADKIAEKGYAQYRLLSHKDRVKFREYYAKQSKVPDWLKQHHEKQFSGKSTI